MKLKVLLILAVFSLSLIALPAQAAGTKFVGWVPYWKKSLAATTTINHISFFTEISPFSYEVKIDGTLIDKMKLTDYPWPEIFVAAGQAKVKIIPAIFWNNKQAMQAVLSNKNKRTAHIKQIVAEVQKNNFAGIDIDYEGKQAATKKPFALFLTELKAELKKNKKLLVCTIEPRTPPQRAVQQILTDPLQRSNDYYVINRECDAIRLMAYDQGRIDLDLNKKYKISGELYAPNADKDWVDKVVRYSLGLLSAKKVYLGVATYGWEYSATGDIGKEVYKKLRSITYADAVKLAAEQGVVPARHAGGELYFSYQTEEGKRLVWFSDARAIKDKIAIVKKYHLAGLAIFKIDSSEDAAIWNLQ